MTGNRGIGACGKDVTLGIILRVFLTGKLRSRRLGFMTLGHYSGGNKLRDMPGHTLSIPGLK